MPTGQMAYAMELHVHEHQTSKLLWLDPYH